MAAATSSASTASMTMVALHPASAASAVPSGAPTAIATVIPVVTVATARPRRSGPARVAAVTVVLGKNRPAPQAASSCATSSRPNVAATALRPVPARYAPSASNRTRRRPHRTVEAARIGSETAAGHPEHRHDLPSRRDRTPNDLPSSGSNPARTSSHVPTTNAPAPSRTDAPAERSTRLPNPQRHKPSPNITRRDWPPSFRADSASPNPHS